MQGGSMENDNTKEKVFQETLDMEDVLEIRDALDELAVRIACQKITDEQLKQLEDVNRCFLKKTGIPPVCLFSDYL